MRKDSHLTSPSFPLPYKPLPMQVAVAESWNIGRLHCNLGLNLGLEVSAQLL